MAIKDIIDTAVDAGKSVVIRGKDAAERRLRGDKPAKTSGSPSTVGAAKAGAAGAPKSATAKKAKPKKAKAKPAKKRSTATRAAATSAEEVSDAAKKD